MCCNKCGAELRDGAKFCPHCGQPMIKDETREASQYADAQKVKRKNNKWFIVVASMLVCIGIALYLFIPSITKTDYWPKNAPDRKTVETTLWEIDTSELDVPGRSLATISVSPSGKYILAAEQV